MRELAVQSAMIAHREDWDCHRHDKASLAAMVSALIQAGTKRATVLTLPSTDLEKTISFPSWEMPDKPPMVRLPHSLVLPIVYRSELSARLTGKVPSSDIFPDPTAVVGASFQYQLPDQTDETGKVVPL